MESDLSSNVSPEVQYAHFLEVVVTEGLIWGLYDEQEGGWALTESTDQQERMPLWPTIELAAEHNTGPWKQFVPQGIDLLAFIENWLDELEEMGRGVSLCYEAEEGGLEVALPYLRRDLIEALAESDEEEA